MENNNARQHDFSNGSACAHCGGIDGPYTRNNPCETWHEMQVRKSAERTGPRPTQAQVDASMRRAGFEASGNAAGLANQIWKVRGGGF